MKIKILDGAMGSELINNGETLPPFIWSAKINLTNPNLVYNIHKQYINSGADYLTTNTFRTTPRAFKKTGLSYKEAFNIAKHSFHSAIKVAKKASQNKAKILGSIAPLEDCYIPSLFPGVKRAEQEFKEIGSWFSKSGIDYFILETMNSIIETEVCIKSIQKFNIPIWVSFNLLNTRQIQSGELLKEAIRMVQGYNIDCLLLNCNPLERTIDALKIIKKNWSKKWGIYPNLGKGDPSPDGKITNYYSNEDFLEIVNQSIKLDVNIIGGCCGSNSTHIDLIKNRLDDRKKIK